MRSFVALGLSAIAAICMAQQVLPGTDLPLTIKPSELTDDFKPLKLKEQSSGILGDYYSYSFLQFGGLGFRSDDPRMTMLSEILPVSWASSKLTEVYGQKYVVTYIFEPSMERIREFSEGKPIGDIVLKLKLLKADQIGSIEPFPELNREKYLTALEAFGESGKAAFSTAKKTMALSNAKQVATGMMIYLSDADDIFPYVQSSKQLVEVLNPYLKSLEVWNTQNPEGEKRFFFNMSLAGVSAMDIKSPATTAMMFDPTPFPDGSHLVAFADGHASYVPADKWAKVQAEMKLKLKRHGKPIK